MRNFIASLKNTPLERTAWLQLARSKNVGIKTIMSLIQTAGSAVAAVSRIDELAKIYKKKIAIVTSYAVESELMAINKLGGRVFLPYDEYFPRQLLEINDMPMSLTALGDIKLTSIKHHKCLAIVGTRHPTLAGQQFISSIIPDLVRENICIVSGLAKGIDATAHQATLNSQGKTIAVLAGGIDYFYPRENKNLQKQIAEEGLVLSENPLGTSPTSHHFPRRNRIISGLSLATLVVEAKLRSGSLITAEFTLEQGRELMAVPGHPLEIRSSGTNHLLRDGATPALNSSDILEVLRKSDQSIFYDSNLQDNNDTAFSSSPTFTTTQVSKLQEKILSLLGYNKAHQEDLLEALGVRTELFQQALSELELAGILKIDSGYIMRNS